eukprot:gene3139-30522_t
MSLPRAVLKQQYERGGQRLAWTPATSTATNLLDNNFDLKVSDDEFKILFKNLIRMFTALLSALLLGVSPIPQQIAPPSTTCAIYQLAYEFGVKVQGSLVTPQQKVDMWDALNLDDCNTTIPAPSRTSPPAPLPSFPVPASSKTSIFVDPVNGADSAAGTMAAPLKTVVAAQMAARKTAAKPVTILLRSGQHVLTETIALTPADSGLTIQAYNGEAAELTGAAPLTKITWEEYNVTKGSGVVMGPALPNINMLESDGAPTQGGNNSHFVFYGKQASAPACESVCASDTHCIAWTWHDGEQPAGSTSWDEQCYGVLTGTTLSNVGQTHHVSGVKTVTQPKNIYRAIRARWPNGDPEYQLFPAGWESSVKWAPPKSFPAAEGIVVLSPNRSDEGPCSSSSGYCYYATGVGGACAGLGFEPPSGYWCAANPPRGTTYSTKVPSSMGYDSSAFEGRSWKHFKPNETVVNAFRDGHWFSYVFLVDQYDPATNSMGWTVGGFQGGEGSSSAAEWNVENVFEELDYPREWYFDTATNDLYYFHNDTAGTSPPDDLAFSGTHLEQLITIIGAGSARSDTGAHVENITIRGLSITGAALTTLAPHGHDGGGDWAIARRAAIHISGAENVAIEDNFIHRIDGNGVMISGYSRNTMVQRNEFFLVGPDATDGNHPQGNQINDNFFHEIESGKSIAAWQAEGHDLGTTVGKTPSDAELIAMAKELLNM